jgi:nucleotide-binding universal stress UspA family protein
MKILLAVDGSDYTKRMLGYVAAHDEMFGSGHDYVALTVVGQVPPELAHFATRSTVEDHYRTQADAVLRPVRAFAAQAGWPLRAEEAVGNAAEVIAAFVEKERPGLVVMGSHGHSAFGGLLLGSVATGVLARCKVPVLIVR